MLYISTNDLIDQLPVFHYQVIFITYSAMGKSEYFHFFNRKFFKQIPNHHPVFVSLNQETADVTNPHDFMVTSHGTDQ